MSKFIPGKTKILYGGVAFGKAERRAIDKILDKNWWGIAEEAQRFEEELARTQGVKRAVFVNSGTSALDLGIRAAKLPKGSEVIVPACTFPTPIVSIIREGLVPVVVDVEEGTNFIDPEAFEKAITRKTKAVLLVYVAGNVGDLDRILSIARKHKLLVFEDNCDGFGGTWKGGMLGSFGSFSAISTHAAHIISTGEGGAVLTDDDELADTVMSLRDWGRTKYYQGGKKFPGFPLEYHRYIYDELGSNYHPLELQAAMGRVQLRRLQEFKSARARHFKILYEGLKDLEEELILPKVYNEADPCWYTFPLILRSGKRRKFVEHLEKANIEWRPILAGNIAKQPVFQKHVVVRDKTPNADRLIKDGLWVSVHPIWPDKAFRYIISTVRSFLTNGKDS